MNRWIKEPLLHFAVIGGGLFVLYGLNGGGNGAAPDEIVVDAPRIAALTSQFERSWRRPPTEVEIDGLIESYVRDEVLYREGLALGLDRDDPVIRARIRVKMEVLGEALEGEVSESDLQAWLDLREADYAEPPRYDFEHVFFDPARDATREGPDLATALGELEHRSDIDPRDLGDPTLLPPALRGVTPSEVAATFGGELSSALSDAPLGRWFGPVPSAYGMHIVRLDRRQESPPPTLAEVRETVERDVLYARAQAASDSMYARLRARYDVRVEADGP